jgi:molybdopterin-guanine dinucleotide biosynthesis protein A
MGQSKTALFFDRVVSAARPVFDDVIAVNRHPERSEGSPRTRSFAVSAAQDDVRVIFEKQHEHDGPIFGVARALREAHSKAFILAVDYPLITSDVLRFLRDRGGVPMWNGEPQLLCAVWEATLLPTIDERIAAGRFDLRGLREHEIIPEAELRQRFAGEPLMNVNTPEEWKAAERLHGG